MHLLLIIDCYLPSTKSAAQLADDLARGFIAQGHEITILAPSDALDQKLTVSDEGRLHVVRYKSGRLKDVNRVVRAINEMLISLVAFVRTRRYLAGRRYDGIVFYSPSIFFGPLVRYFKRRFRARAYLVLRDIFPDWAVNAGVLRKGPVYYVFKMFEHFQYRAADVIGVETSRSVEYFRSTPHLDKVELLRNWTRTDPPPKRERSFRNELGLEDKIVFFYGGNIGVAQDMDNIMRLAKSMADRPDVHFLFVGDGSEVPRLKKMIADEGMDNTTIHPSVDPDTYLAMLSEFDVGLITLDRRLKTYSNTGKILGYMRCGLPILASYNPGNDLEELLRDSQAGLGSVNGDGDDLLLGNALSLCDPAERQRMGANSRKLLDDVFAVDKIARQILAGCAHGRSRQRMRVLFLSHYFPPEVNPPASRTYEHTREWVKAGHEVTVVTCAPNHPAGKLYAGYRNKLWQWEEKDGIRILRVWTFMAANEGFLLRTTNYVSYMISAILAAPFLAGADVVLSTSPQFFSGLAGYFVARIKRAPWILEIRDLWPDSILVVGAIRNRLVIRSLQALERWAYRKADRIVSVTDSFCGHFERLGSDPARTRVIKNGVNLGFFSDPQKDEALSREIGADGKFVAAYFGTHGMAHHLETVFEAASITADRDDILYLLVGDGAERARLLDMRDELGLDNVAMLGQQPRDRMPALWGVCDASLVMLKKDDLFKLVIPSKIFEAMAMERPVVLGVEGESRAIVEAGRCGIPIEPENAEELAAAVRRLADDRRLQREMGANGRRYVTENFDRVALAKRYLDLIEELVGSRRGATRAN